mmetsp:Transcript_23289/g.78856  ORF Transcript_23289/g.78856 Transcript_23289/m.78856 type:complete len:208 (-) Transcript_23289:994-1617(-)
MRGQAPNSESQEARPKPPTRMPPKKTEAQAKHCSSQPPGLSGNRTTPAAARANGAAKGPDGDGPANNGRSRSVAVLVASDELQRLSWAMSLSSCAYKAAGKHKLKSTPTVQPSNDKTLASDPNTEAAAAPALSSAATAAARPSGKRRARPSGEEPGSSATRASRSVTVAVASFATLAAPSESRAAAIQTSPGKSSRMFGETPGPRNQ